MSEDATFAAILAHATRALQQHLGLNQIEARLEALLFIRHSYDISKATVLACLRDPAAPNKTFDELLTRRINGEPVAYILNEREFYGLTFETNPRVLIPRPETETLVELALAKIEPNAKANILELGTGSGAIAIALGLQRPKATITATDISADALAVARRNGTRHEINNIIWLQSDWYASLPAREFDLIVSNPPYVAENDLHLRQGDLRFEPRGALASGLDGLAAIKHIIERAQAFLAPGAWLLFEHGYDQARRCREILRENRYSEIETHCDLAGIERVSGGRRAIAMDIPR